MEQSSAHRDHSTAPAATGTQPERRGSNLFRRSKGSSTSGGSNGSASNGATTTGNSNGKRPSSSGSSNVRQQFEFQPRTTTTNTSTTTTTTTTSLLDDDYVHVSRSIASSASTTTATTAGTTSTSSTTKAVQRRHTNHSAKTINSAVAATTPRTSNHSSRNSSNSHSSSSSSSSNSASLATKSPPRSSSLPSSHAATTTGTTAPLVTAKSLGGSGSSSLHGNNSGGPTIVRGIPVVTATASAAAASSPTKGTIRQSASFPTSSGNSGVSSNPHSSPSKPPLSSTSTWRPPLPLLTRTPTASSFSSNASVTSYGSGDSRESNSTRTKTSKKSLHKKKASLSQYQTTPITKHYELSRQILSAFDSHWSNHLYVTAYAVGLQFVETALLEIPKHGYFYSARHERERMESSLEAARVAHLLSELLQQDKPQSASTGGGVGIIPNGNLPHVQRLLALAMEQIEKASSDQDDHTATSTTTVAQQQQAFEAARAEVEEDVLLRTSQTSQNDPNGDDCLSTTGDWIVCGGGSGNDYCGAAGSLFMGQREEPPHAQPPQAANRSSTTPSAVVPQQYIPPAFYSNSTTTTATHGHKTNSNNTESDYISQSIALQEERLRSFTPPSTTTATKATSIVLPTVPLNRSSSVASIQSEELMLEKALFLSGLEVSVASIDVGYNGSNTISSGRQETIDEERIPPPPREAARVQSAAYIEHATVARCYHEDFDALQSAGLVRISFAETYQGRLPASTNGCTVIAPMLCIQHLLVELDDFYYDAGGDPGLSDSTIAHVIDADSPVVLVQLRKRLGLPEKAFLIPADAHDYLLDNEQLTPDQFHTVVGGNILHDDHLMAFITALADVKHKKIAATLFFHEHVVAILKLKRVDRRGTVSWWYDVIDSLPLKETLRRCDESPHELCQRMGLLNGLSDEETFRENDMVALPKTARIRCLSEDALMGVIRWYACSKFNDENMAYIDQYQWDDAACDFDPRVFQAFLWGGSPFQ